jgi:predicted enzyme related to lactoylglutathione lyase
MAEMTTYAHGTPCWIDLGTTDLAAAGEFYRELFGWELQERPDAGGYTMAMLNGKTAAGMYPMMDAMKEQGIPPFWTTYLASDDVQRTAELVPKAGGKVMAGPMQVFDLGMGLVTQDPTGAAGGAWQGEKLRGAQVANEPGAVTWNELVTRDVPAARAFYTEVYGFETEEMEVGLSEPYILLKVAGHEVGGIVTTPPQYPPQAPSSWLSYFATADTDAGVATVQRAGGSVMSEPRDSPYGRMAIVGDPQGGTFALIEVAPQS